MDTNYLDIGGELAAPDELRSTRARELIDPIVTGRLDFVRVVECRRRGDIDVLVLELDVERPQQPVNDIRRMERVAVEFAPQDDRAPVVLSLRSDFPLVPHLNLGVNEYPRSLCLYDRPWPEVRTRWTAAAFIETIRRWLSDTSTGMLHRDDQPLEPLLFGSGYQLILPADYVAMSGEATERLELTLIRSGKTGGTLIAEKATQHRTGDRKQFIASLFIADAKTHGIISRAPRTLEDLCNFVKSEHFDLLDELRQRVRKWKDDGCLDASLIIVVTFPLRREQAESPEITDVWAFATTSSVYDVGKQIGVWDKVDNKIGLLMPCDASMRGAKIDIDIVRPQFAFSRYAAASANGGSPDERAITAVGVGALGSQVSVHLFQAGVGRWSFIDDDVLLPHNLARHALPPWCVGLPKAQGMAHLADAYYEDQSPAQAIVADVLQPNDDAAAVDGALNSAEWIIDFAASVPVARHLSHHPSGARRASLFLNPTGTDLVCLREGPLRDVPLDCLELQYYRAVLRDDRLQGHLAANPDKRRYARTCRDVTFALPTHQVSLLSAIGAQAVKASLDSTHASIDVWRMTPGTCEVRSITVPVQPVHRFHIGQWTLVVDDGLLVELADLRAAKLPNETGGVLIGTFDLPAKTVYVVDIIPSPPDSAEWPTLYIRGSEGLRSRVAEIAELTAGQLEYCGEWHSHPEGCSCDPSTDDMKVFSWITDRMTAAGLPALMAIVGQRQSSQWFVGQMADRHLIKNTEPD